MAKAFYYAGLVERWGTGTTRIAEACRERGLPAPEFEASEDRFAVTFHQDSYTEERLRELGLSDRQVLIMRRAKEKGSIRNASVQQLTEVSKRTASRDLSALEEQSLLQCVGETGKGTRYQVAEAEAL